VNLCGRLHEACHLKATNSERAARDAETRFKNYALNHAKLATELPKLEDSCRMGRSPDLQRDLPRAPKRLGKPLRRASVESDEGYERSVRPRF
jgi:hypothetical protein